MVVPDGILIGSQGSSEKVAKQNKSALRQVGPLFLRYFSLSFSLSFSPCLQARLRGAGHAYSRVAFVRMELSGRGIKALFGGR